MDIQVIEQQNNQSNIIGTINLDDNIINVYGTIHEPLIKCVDLLIECLKYRDCDSARWFRTIKHDQDYVKIIHGVTPCKKTKRYFTEIGIYASLMKSDKPIAMQFQKQVYKLLQTLRNKQLDKIQEQNEQIQQLQLKYNSTLKHGCIYALYNKKYQCIDYIGQTSHKSPDNRIQQHKQAMQKGLELPFYRSLIIQQFNETIEVQTLEQVEYSEDVQLVDYEKYHQILHKSTFNQKELTCGKCQVKYNSKSIQCFENHRQDCYSQ